jgi:hypothetical protein
MVPNIAQKHLGTTTVYIWRHDFLCGDSIPPRCASGHRGFGCFLPVRCFGDRSGLIFCGLCSDRAFASGKTLESTFDDAQFALLYGSWLRRFFRFSRLLRQRVRLFPTGDIKENNGLGTGNRLNRPQLLPSLNAEFRIRTL